MSDHTQTPWRVFKTTDGRKLVGVGAQDGQGILDSGYGVWSWDDAEGIANAELVVKAVNNHERMVRALTELHAMVWGECPSLLNEDSGGNARLDIAIRNILNDLIAPRHT